MSKKKASANILMPPTAGSKISVLKKTLSLGNIESKYKHRAVFSYFVSGISVPFKWLENKFIDPNARKLKLDKPPVFILGHWRSGTTYLHNLISQDPQVAFVDTYQSTFPEMLLSKPGRTLFRGFMKLAMPKRRAGDNVQMNADFPQEEEFALGNLVNLGFYYFWYFPSKTLEFFDRFLLFKGCTSTEISEWKQAYSLLINKAVINTGKSLFVSKNPPNTARISTLKELYPNARFIYIHRNPVEVFLSTQNFFKNMMPYLQYEEISEEEQETLIFDLYKALFKAYRNQSAKLTSDQFQTISYDDLLADPLGHLKRIYSELDISGFDEALPHFEEYIAGKKTYQRNKHKISRQKLDKILEEWGFAMEHFGYELPKSIEIID